MAWVKRFSDADREKILRLAKETLRSEEGREALNYLTNVRKLSPQVIDQFEMGYCPERVPHQVSGRIITPIYDAHNNLIVLSTRHLDESSDFRFWHETFSKSLYFYGLNYAKRSIIKSRKAIIVEGEMDVAALHSRGFTMTIGVCGSALTLFQISLLSKYCSSFYLMFDGDEAGKRATASAMELYKKNDLDAHQLEFIPVNLEEGYDPDEYVKKYGRVKLRDKLVEAKEEYTNSV